MAEQAQESLDELFARYKEVEARRREALDVLFDESLPPAERRKAYREAEELGRQTKKLWREIKKHMGEL